MIERIETEEEKRRRHRIKYYEDIMQPKKTKTYNTRDSLVVTDPTTNPAVSGLTRGERTGSRVLQILWSYVLGIVLVFT